MSRKLEPTDIFRQNLRDLPAFLALLRAVEHRFFNRLELSKPILDLGCGDGHFASTVFENPLNVGIDLRLDSVMSAKARNGVYRVVVQGSAGDLPFEDEEFGSVISNSVLEHIPQPDRALREIARILRSGSLFAFTVPSEYFREFLGVSAVMSRMQFYSMARGYQRFFDRISRHYHYYSLREWRGFLEEAGFEIQGHRYYFSRQALRALERWHYLGLPSLVCRKLTGRWVLAPSDTNLRLTDKLLRRHYEEPLPDLGAYLYIVAKRLF